MEKRIKYLEKIVHTSGMLNNDFNNLFLNENNIINDDEILHKSIPSSNKLKSRVPPLIERQKGFNKSDNM